MIQFDCLSVVVSSDPRTLVFTEQGEDFCFYNDYSEFLRVEYFVINSWSTLVTAGP